MQIFYAKIFKTMEKRTVKREINQKFKKIPMFYEIFLQMC